MEFQQPEEQHGTTLEPKQRRFPVVKVAGLRMVHLKVHTQVIEIGVGWVMMATRRRAQDRQGACSSGLLGTSWHFECLTAAVPGREKIRRGLGA